MASAPSYLAFAAYGLFWGTWGAALPALREAAAIDDAQLGVALLFVGVGGLPAMAVTGRAVDRFGARLGGALLIALAFTGVLMAATATGLAALSVGMLLVGAASGAADVADNALAGLAEQRSGRRVITLAHAVFSSAVVAGCLAGGAMAAADAGVVERFAAPGVIIVAAGAAVLWLGDGAQPRGPAVRAPRREGWRLLAPFVIVGLVGALGFAAENAHQSWSAIFLGDELGSAAGLAAIAPATFAAFAALARFGAGFTRIPSGALLVGGAITATAGTLMLAVAQQLPGALAGLALAAAGTAVLYPTLMSRATRDVPAGHRGRATATVAATSYLGFVLGPVYVGFLAAMVGLRGAMIGVAVLAVAFAVLAPLVTRERTNPLGGYALTSSPREASTRPRRSA